MVMATLPFTQERDMSDIFQPSLQSESHPEANFMNVMNFMKNGQKCRCHKARGRFFMKRQ
jgi:hypothetical protein